MCEKIDSEKNECGNPVMTDAIIQYMKGIGPWQRFLSILAFVFLGLMLLMLIGFASGGMFKMPGMGTFPGVMFFILFLIFCALYFFPAYFLFKSSSGIKLMKSGKLAEGMESSLKYMKSFWMYIGILMIVFLSLYLLMFIPVVFMGLFKSLPHQ